MRYIAKSDLDNKPVENTADLDQALQRNIGAIPDLTRIRLGRQVRHLHRLGERVLLEELISSQYLPFVLSMAANMMKWGLSHKARRVNELLKHPWLDSDTLWRLLPAGSHELPMMDVTEFPPLSDAAATALSNRYFPDSE